MAQNCGEIDSYSVTCCPRSNINTNINGTLSNTALDTITSSVSSPSITTSASTTTPATPTATPSATPPATTTSIVPTPSQTSHRVVCSNDKSSYTGSDNEHCSLRKGWLQRTGVNLSIVPMKAGYFFSIGAIHSLVLYLVLYMKDLGLTSSECSLILGLVQFIGAIIAALLGLLADVTRRHRLVVVGCCCFTGVFHFALAFVPGKMPILQVPVVCEHNATCYVMPLPPKGVSYCNTLLNASDGFTHQKVKGNRGMVSDDLWLGVEESTPGCNVSFSSISCQLTSDLINRLDGEYGKNKIKDQTKDVIVNVTCTGSCNSTTSGSRLTPDHNAADTCQVGLKFDVSEHTMLLCQEIGTSGTLETCKQKNTAPFTSTFVWFALIYALAQFSLNPVISLIDAMSYNAVLNSADVNSSKQWGQVRLWGSIGVGVFALLSGSLIYYVTNHSSLEISPYLPCFILFLICSELAAVSLWCHGRQLFTSVAPNSQAVKDTTDKDNAIVKRAVKDTKCVNEKYDGNATCDEVSKVGLSKSDESHTSFVSEVASHLPNESKESDLERTNGCVNGNLVGENNGFISNHGNRDGHANHVNYRDISSSSPTSAKIISAGNTVSRSLITRYSVPREMGEEDVVAVVNGGHGQVDEGCYHNEVKDDSSPVQSVHRCLKGEEKGIFGKTLKLISSPDIMIMFTMSFYMGMMLGATHTFLFWHLDVLDGHDSSQEGVASSDHAHQGSSNGLLYAACCIANMLPELAAFAYSGLLIRKLGHCACMVIGSTAYAVRMFGYSVITGPWQALILEPLHGLSFALFYAAASGQVAKVTPPQMQATVQSTISSLHFGFGHGTGSLVFGELVSRHGTGSMYRTASYIAASVSIIYPAVDRVLQIYNRKRVYNLKSDSKSDSKDSIKK